MILIMELLCTRFSRVNYCHTHSKLFIHALRMFLVDNFIGSFTTVFLVYGRLFVYAMTNLNSPIHQQKPYTIHKYTSILFCDTVGPRRMCNLIVKSITIHRISSITDILVTKQLTFCLRVSESINPSPVIIFLQNQVYMKRIFNSYP